MYVYEDITHSFIVRVWLEEFEGVKPPIWRGYIKHVNVPNEEPHYVQDLDEITDFIYVYLHRMGVRLPLSQKVIRWMRKVKL